MGDGADLCLDAGWEQELDGTYYDGDDSAEGAASYYGHWRSNRRSSFPPKTRLRCRKCNEVGVYWKQYPSGKWFIFDTCSHKPHVCKDK